MRQRQEEEADLEFDAPEEESAPEDDIDQMMMKFGGCASGSINFTQKNKRMV
jgi:hypothetical protein